MTSGLGLDAFGAGPRGGKLEGSRSVASASGTPLDRGVGQSLLGRRRTCRSARDPGGRRLAACRHGQEDDQQGFGPRAVGMPNSAPSRSATASHGAETCRDGAAASRRKDRRPPARRRPGSRGIWAMAAPSTRPHLSSKLRSRPRRLRERRRRARPGPRRGGSSSPPARRGSSTKAAWVHPSNIAWGSWRRIAPRSAYAGA